MNAPTGLPPRVAELRAEALADLAAMGSHAPEPAITRYAHALALAERSWAAIPARRPVGRSDRGGQRVHPAVDAALAAERAAIEFGRLIGLEPEAAKRAPGRPKATSSAPDRQAGEPPRLRVAGAR